MKKVLFFVISLLVIDTMRAQETPRERELLDRIDGLEKRLADVEARLAAMAGPAGVNRPATETAAAKPVEPAVIPKPEESAINRLFGDTTVNVAIDGYYSYNFNRAPQMTSQLHAFDGPANTFALNQANIVIEKLPNAEAGNRLGGRLDLQFGQATATLQGNSLNEPNPNAIRNVFQAYGSYVLPVGSGLQVDFGKFASSLGTETNYTKDNFNYSRAFWFSYLPYYHFGLRANYAFNSKVSAQYWLVNGENEAQDFNAYKSQAFLLNLKPVKTLTLNTTYYFGEEGHATTATAPVSAFNGRTHIFDAYLTWTPANSKWSAGLEGDYVINRDFINGPPARVDGGAAYLQYQITPKFALAGRFELLQDRGGSYTGNDQTLKEFTLTGTHQVADGFQWKMEYRHDYSNLAYFYTSNPAVRQRTQDTALLGLMWWFGGKTGAW